MAWIVIRPFSYRGTRYRVGEEVPAESWPSRRMFEARRKIRNVPVSAEGVTKSQLKAMTRAELNKLAFDIGIEDAEKYPNRDALIARIKGSEDDDAVAETEDEQPVQEPAKTEKFKVDVALEEMHAEQDSKADDTGDEDTEDSDSEEDSEDEDSDDEDE